MLNKNIVLFDMDGTLTPAREKADIPIAVALSELARISTVGIVTGSQYEYLVEQCGTILNSIVGPDLSKILLFPCNGGQYYEWSNTNWRLISDKNMRSHFGEKKFNDIIKSCICILNATLEEHDGWNLTGPFVEYRGPMINLCFPGRQANKKDRKLFEHIDQEKNIRNLALRRLIGKMQFDNIEGVELKLGGNTSIDIFPTGWDKTLALEHLNEYTVWFVGDRCTGSGNDKEIYDHAKQYNRGYETKGPAQTIEIINEIISKIKGN